MDELGRWEADVLLADGGPMHVRPVRPGDEPLIATFHARQSSESIYFRYFSARPTLSQRELEHLTHVDYVDRMAFIGLIGDELVGIARYDRYPTSGVAEVAFFTDDAQRGRGMATVLLEYLAAAARESGISGFVAQVLPQNRRMLSVFKQAGFEVHSHFEDGIIEVELGIEPTPEARAVIDERARNAFARSVHRMLAPTSIAVIGASRRPEAIGHQIVRRIIDGGFTGVVHPVNPQADSIGSVRSFPSVAAIPSEVDLAIVCVPASEVRGVVMECARKHVHGLVVISAGFAESGPEGAALEHEVVTLAHRHGMRVIGPNSMGIVNTAANVSLQGTFVGIPALPGSIGVSSQSGTLGAAIIGHARRLGLGISTFVSLGNKPDVSNNDLLQYWEDDDATDIALLHLESFGNPHNFARITRRLTRSKPVVAVKSGRAVHLAETADDLPLEASLDALLAQTGVIRVDTLEELFDVTVVLSHQPVARGRRLAIVSNSWGPASLACDAAIGAGLELAELEGGARANPIDLGYQAGASDFANTLSRVRDDPGVDAVLVLCTPPVPEDLDHLAGTIARVANGSTVPFVATYLGMEPNARVDGLRTVPAFEFPEAAVHALGRIARYGEWLARDPGTLPDPSLIDLEAARAVVDAAMAHDAGWVDPDVAARLLAAAGCTLVERRLVDDAGQAVAAADEIGWPVALKATGLARPAKTEAGGIAVDVHDETELGRAHARMVELLGEAMRPAVVQQMAPPGIDVRVGLVRHHLVGSVVTLTVDSTFAQPGAGAGLQVVPCSDLDARRLLEGAGVGEALTQAELIGAGADAALVGKAEDALVDLVLRLSLLAEAVPELAAVHLDPVMLSGTGAWLTDVRVRLASPARRPGPEVRRLVGEDEA
jgi:acyl-CoA synthetase (NDP forming)/RimJ/RimL family protein N-acetyltransferase